LKCGPNESRAKEEQSHCFDDLKQKIGEFLQGKRKILFPPQKEKTDMGKMNKKKKEGLSFEKHSFYPSPWPSPTRGEGR
jgi:hypothetical protein